jgi:hypothetical protein
MAAVAPLGARSRQRALGREGAEYPWPRRGRGNHLGRRLEAANVQLIGLPAAPQDRSEVYEQ